MEDYNFKQRQEIIHGVMSRGEKLAWTILVLVTVAGVIMLSVLY